MVTLAEEEEEVLEKLKGKPEVQTEHAEGLLSKGLHKKKTFYKITKEVAQENAGWPS